MFNSIQFSPSVLSVCDPMDCSTPGLPVYHELPELTQTHVHWVWDPTFSSSVVPFSSRLQSFPASGSFPVSQFFPSSSQSIASAVLMNIQDWFPLGWTGWISLQSKGLSRVFSSTTVQSINSSVFNYINFQSYHLFSSVAQLCLILWDPMVCSIPGFPVHHQLLELTQTHFHWVSDAIQPSHPLSSPSSPAFSLPQHQGLSNESALRIRWPKYWSFNFNVSPSSEYSGLISFRMH